MAIGGVITAMVTPFEVDGRVAEEAAVRLIHHLTANGSDGLVIAGTTGEASTLSDDEKCRLFELAVAEAGEAMVIANTGSNDTAHSAHLTARASDLGVDAVLVVTPYYNKPNRRGLVAHYEAVAAATDKPVVLYNIPSRSVVDMPNDLLEELAAIPNVQAVKQARSHDVRPLEGLDLLAGNDDMLADVLDMGGTGGVLVASHVVGPEMRQMIDEPDSRQERSDSLAEVYEAMGVTSNPIPVKAALNMLGLEVGGLRLPLVEASAEEATRIREALERHGLLSAV